MTNFGKKEINDLATIAALLKKGKVGIFPCDTIWGLIGKASSTVAKKIHKIKNRPEYKPFIILIPDKNYLPALILDAEDEKIINQTQKYWPGPYTLILQKNPKITANITAGLDTIGLRLPNFAPLNMLLNLVNEPLISTSVNLHQNTFAKNLAEMPQEIIEKIDFVYTAAAPSADKPSQIINCATAVPHIIR